MSSTKLPIKITLPENYFQSEERCGYSVCEKLKKIWAVELDLLVEFKRVCDLHGIRFQLFAGTLLGTIRHQGFIPWDDDVDVAVSRDDFDKLVRLSAEFKHPYFLQTASTDRKYYLSYARLRNGETTGAIGTHAGIDYNNGIYIDIFVLDGLPNSEMAWNLQRVFRRLIWVLMCRWYSGRGWVRKFIRVEKLWRAYDFITSYFTSSANRIGLMTHNSDFSRKYWLYKEEFLNSKSGLFEGYEFPVPVDSERVLKRIYGDWKKFPVMEERGQWHAANGLIFEPDVPYLKYFKT